ncbi:MAG: type II CRISPR-associated endonuclease Cas1 [Methylococcales symbiont of Hymedesmia sp. n. MRB-2018]|nr:MAG: type II CRISPR-associated endonuclease Cas1 [Methylococcales symbiont of Hymedesmia sp. n. MRB-2018]KAF3983603.1 MAG: type II CRISPR-associated endonuclease Cas1 [Methylococcales symbiont of Hymedesmia sp. n. MRB-2018]
MIKRIIDISDAAYLHLKNKQLLIDKQGETVGQIIIEDLGVLILQHPAIVLTQQVIIACQKNKVVIVFCDHKHLPYSVILPIAESHTLHNKILKQQIAITQPTRKRLWQQIVQQKIIEQAKTLTALGKNTSRLDRIVAQVKTGDSTNCEAVAAQVYWRLLFGNDFRRNVDMEGINSLLNYGYSIIRAAVARSICGAGLHPTLGIFHSNQYNALCLADDIMEPFRAWVDILVYQLAEQGELEVNQQTKQVLLGLLSESVEYENKKMPFMIAIHYLMADLKRCYSKAQKKLLYPSLETRLFE